jgi:hypothetical protein
MVTPKQPAPEPPLVAAARARERAAVRRLLSEGHDVEAAAANGHTALMWAARHEDHATATLLLEAGAGIDQTDGRGWTALAWAAFEDARKSVSFLLERGASPRASRSMPIRVAVRQGHVRIVERLVDTGADLAAVDDDDRTALENAAASPDPALVAAVLKGNPPQPSRDRALVEAAYHGHLRAVELLLDAGADPTFTTKRGNSALGVARKRRHKDVVALLVGRGTTVAKTRSAKRAISPPPRVKDGSGPSHAALVSQLGATAATKRRSAAKKIGATRDAAYEGVLVAALAKELEDVRAWEGQVEMARALGAIASSKALAAWLERLVIDVRFEATMVPMALAGAACRIGARTDRGEVERLLARALDDIAAKDERLAACAGILEVATEVGAKLRPDTAVRLASFLADPGELPRHGEAMLARARRAWSDHTRSN